MKTLKAFLSLFLTLAFLAAIGVGMYYLLRWTGGYLMELDPQMTLIAGVVVLGLLLVGWLVRGVRRGAGQSRWRIEKAQAYRRWLGAWAQQLRRPAGGRAGAELESAEQAMLLYAGSTVLRNWSAVRDLRRPPASDAERLAVERLLRSMRADLGQVTIGLKSGDLSAWFLGSGEEAGGQDAEPRDGPRDPLGAIGDGLIPRPFLGPRQGDGDAAAGSAPQ